MTIRLFAGAVGILILFAGESTGREIRRHDVKCSTPPFSNGITLHAGGALAVIRCDRHIQVNDRLYGPFIDIGKFVCSADGAKYGFACSGRFGDKSICYQINDTRYGPYAEYFNFGYQDYLAISPDGSNFAYGYLDKGGFYVRTAGGVTGPYIFACNFAFNENGSALAYRYEKSGLWDLPGNCCCIPFQNVFTAVNYCLSFQFETTANFTGSHGSGYVRVNDEIFGGYDRRHLEDAGAAGHDTAIILRKNSFAFVYRTRFSDKKHVRINGRTFGPFDSVGVPVFSDDGANYAFSYVDRHNGFVQYRDSRHGPFPVPSENNWRAVFSRDLSRMAIVYLEYRPKEGFFVVRDDNKFGPFVNVIGASFSPDGSRFGFLFERYERRERGSDLWFYAMIDGREYGPYYRYQHDPRLEFSRDGAHFGFNIRDGKNKNAVVIDGRQYAAEDFAFTPRSTPVIASFSNGAVAVDELDD